MFGNTPAYKAIELPHSLVHKKVLVATACLQANNCLVTQRDAMIENMAAAEVESFKLFDLFVRMVEEGNPEVKI